MAPEDTGRENEVLEEKEEEELEEEEEMEEEEERQGWLYDSDLRQESLQREESYGRLGNTKRNKRPFEKRFSSSS